MDNGASSYRRFLDGDDNGLVEIIKDYKDGLILYLCGFTDNILTAEEVMEETFVKLAVRKPRFSSKSSFKSWLYAIGRNTAIDRMRHKSKNTHENIDDYSAIAAEETEFEKSFLIAERKIRLHSAIKTLKAEHRQVLWLVYFEDFSVSEAAKASTPQKIFYTEQDFLSKQNSKRRASFMKNYNEVASDVFEKRDRLLKQKKSRQKKAVQIGLPVVCICAVAAVISGVKAHPDTAPEQAAEIVSATVAAVQTTQKTENKILINTALPENVDMNSICDFYIDINDYVPMTKDELRTFYGTEIFPRVPDDMAEYVGHLGAGSSRSYGIYRANGGTGEVTHDNQLIMYVNREAEGNRSLEIEVSKRFRYMSVNNFGSIYTHDELTKDLSCSVINGVEVYIYYHSKADYYAVNFIYNDTGFSIRADGFSEAEVVAVTESLTECGDKFKGNEYNPNPILPMIRDFEGEPLNAKVAPENGTVIMTPALQNAMEHYGDEAKYNVCITVCKSRKALDIRSDEVTAERERLVELGYITFLENYWSGEESTTVFGCHFSYEELQNFTVSEDYGYILYLYDE